MSLSAPVQLARDLEWLDIQHRKRDDLQTCGDLLHRARELQRDAYALNIPDMIAVSHLRTGNLLRAQRKYDQALEQAARARAVLGRLREEDLQVQALALEVECLADLGRWVEVNQSAAEAIGLVECYRYRVSPPYLKAAYLKARISVYGRGVEAALIAGDTDLALRRAELCKSRGVSVSGSGNPLDSEQVNALQSQITELNRAVDRAGEKETVSLRARRRLLWDLLVMAQTDTGWADRLPHFDRNAIAAKLLPGQAVLYFFWIDRTHLFRLLLDCTGCWFDVYRVPAQMRQALGAYCASILGMERRSARSLVDQVQQFEALLWPQSPAASQILQRTTRLLISPHRQLHAVPFSALRTDGEYLGMRYALRMLPNLTSLLAPGPPAGQRHTALAVGVRRYSVPDIPLDPLPVAEDEAAGIASLYGNTGHGDCLTGGDVSEQSLRDAAQNGYQILHLACHGINVDADTPLESGLFLSTTRLEALRFPLLGLKPSLVVLNACCSGQRSVHGRDMDELPGDDLLGLSAMLFCCGVREILAPLYPVQDSPARDIGLRFHHWLIQGWPADVALQRALREYRESAGCLSATPYFWAAFQLTALGSSLPLPVEVGAR